MVGIEPEVRRESQERMCRRKRAVRRPESGRVKALSRRWGKPFAARFIWRGHMGSGEWMSEWSA